MPTCRGDLRLLPGRWVALAGRWQPRQSDLPEAGKVDATLRQRDAEGDARRHRQWRRQCTASLGRGGREGGRGDVVRPAQAVEMLTAVAVAALQAVVATAGVTEVTEVGGDRREAKEEEAAEGVEAVVVVAPGMRAAAEVE